MNIYLRAAKKRKSSLLDQLRADVASQHSLQVYTVFTCSSKTLYFGCPDIDRNKSQGHLFSASMVKVKRNDDTLSDMKDILGRKGFY